MGIEKNTFCELFATYFVPEIILIFSKLQYLAQQVNLELLLCWACGSLQLSSRIHLVSLGAKLLNR